MKARLAYAIRFTADMDRAIAFHRDVLGLTVKFATPEWTEFDTGSTTLALHPASSGNPAGTVQLGFAAENLAALYAEREANGLHFTQAPFLEHGTLLSRIRDGEGAEISLSGKP